MGPLIDADPFDEDTTGAEIGETLQRVHESRPEIDQRIDEQRDAKLTTDPEKWANNPDEYDYPGIDTGPDFDDANPGFDRDSFIDQFR